MVAFGANQSNSALPWIYLGFLGHIVALLLFDAGMFPVKPVTVDNASWSDYGLEPGSDLPNRYDRVFKRVVVLLIDGIRADFVWGDEKRMPFARSLLDSGRGMGFVTLAHAPTVTLPRLKAILTGSVPLFSDAVMNVQHTSALTQDNVISYMKAEHGARVVAYGDNIWGTLFPGEEAFLRREWVVSFFVSDFVHVDLNVTKHVALEMQRADWDVLVLHYLGLDHIGHFEGPTSKHVRPKLLEMDDIVREVYESLAADDLLLVLGDHGTGDAGGHGGSSAAEVRTPALFFGPKMEVSTAPPTSVSDAPVVNQIDLASTLASLLGVPIPKSNMGRIMVELLQRVSSGDQRELLRCLAANTQQLLQAVNASSVPASKKEKLVSQFEAVTSLHGAHIVRAIQGSSTQAQTSHAEGLVASYASLLEALSTALVESSVHHDNLAMGSAIYLLPCLVILSALYQLFPTAFHQCLASSSVMLVSTIFSVFLQVSICTSPTLGCCGWLCSVTAFSIPVLVLHFAVTTLAGALLLSLGTWLIQNCAKLYARASCAGVGRSFFSLRPSSLSFCLVAGSLCHLSLLSASSFVEEEHQIWYFLATSFVLCVLVNRKLAGRSKASVVKPANAAAGGGGGSGEQDIGCGMSMETLGCLLSLVLLRAMRSWNQTGDKWLYLPDVSSWFAGDDHLMARSTLAALSLCVVAGSFLFRGKCTHLPAWRVVLLLVGLPVVYLARAAMKQFYWPSVFQGILFEDGYAEAHALFSLSIGLIVADVAYVLYYRVRGLGTDGGVSSSARTTAGLLDVYSVYLLLMCLLSRAQNVVVMAALAVQHLLFDMLVWPTLSAWQVAVSSMWMGFTGFYMQGNSNALSKIDLTPGYVGMRDFEPAHAFLMITLSVWASLLMWLLVGFGHVARRHQHHHHHHHQEEQQQLTEQQQPHNHQAQQQGHGSHMDMPSIPEPAYSDSRGIRNSELSQFLTTVITYQMAISTVVAIVTMAMRHHIMVWTVFSPKVLYITSQSIHIFCLVGVLLFSKWLICTMPS